MMRTFRTARSIAINGSADFDVYDIDLGTLIFGGLEVRVRGNIRPLCSIEDWNDDDITALKDLLSTDEYQAMLDRIDPGGDRDE